MTVTITWVDAIVAAIVYSVGWASGYREAKYRFKGR